MTHILAPIPSGLRPSSKLMLMPPSTPSPQPSVLTKAPKVCANDSPTLRPIKASLSLLSLQVVKADRSTDEEELAKGAHKRPQ